MEIKPSDGGIDSDPLKVDRQIHCSIVFSTMTSEEYLTLGEVAARLKVNPKTIRNKWLQEFLEKVCIFFGREVSVRDSSGLQYRLG